MSNTMEKILVPVCIDCNKPHFGRKNVEDRCICDTSGRFEIKEITKEE